jgi:hypothetical protein
MPEPTNRTFTKENQSGVSDAESLVISVIALSPRVLCGGRNRFDIPGSGQATGNSVRRGGRETRSGSATEPLSSPHQQIAEIYEQHRGSITGGDLKPQNHMKSRYYCARAQ